MREPFCTENQAAQSGQSAPSYRDINQPVRRRLKIAGVEERTGVHRQTIWRWYKAGLFPAPHFLGRDRLWFEDEVETWERRRMSECAAQHAAA